MKKLLKQIDENPRLASLLLQKAIILVQIDNLKIELKEVNKEISKENL